MNGLNSPQNRKFHSKKKARDHMAKQAMMQECITDSLRKQTGGNCQRSFASIAKVVQCVYATVMCCLNKPYKY
jgi:hypothetical protein